MKLLISLLRCSMASEPRCSAMANWLRTTTISSSFRASWAAAACAALSVPLTHWRCSTRNSSCRARPSTNNWFFWASATANWLAKCSLCCRSAVSIRSVASEWRRSASNSTSWTTWRSRSPSSRIIASIVAAWTRSACDMVPCTASLASPLINSTCVLA